MTPTLGRYEIVRLLGRGGMAEVFVARRRSAGGIEKQLVIKRIRSERAADPRLIALFVREARVSMALSHQNIVPVFDFGRAGDALFLAMELVDGRDLGAVLDRARDRAEPMDPLLIAFVGAECCAALAYAHGKRFDDGTTGVVHRDVTPRNILVSWSGEVRLTDFGVAAIRSDADAKVRGTPRYMAPEQARGEEVDGRADLYALGLVLREAATGEAARPDEARAALAAARSGVLPATPELPGGLGDVIARATAARPEDRYPDARAMREALDRVVAALRGDRGSPSGLLADWLRALYGEARPEPLPRTGTVMSGVTFLDDGEEAILGSATARSLAGTVADVEAPPVEPAPPPAPPRRRSPVPLALAGVALATAATVWIATRPDTAPVAAAEADAGAAAAAAAAAAADAATAAAAAAAADAAAAASVPDAGAATAVAPAPARDARPARVRVRPRPDADAGAAAAVDKRKVTIHSRPWAYFYVDRDPTRHEPMDTVELAPGAHTVRFVNEAAHIDRTITLDVPPDRDIKHVEPLTPDTP